MYKTGSGGTPTRPSTQGAALVVTTIHPPGAAMRALARGCEEAGWDFIVVGDQATPPNFQLSGCNFHSYQQQCGLSFKYVNECPLSHYARKNVGYLLAIQRQPEFIVETDDDNHPMSGFFPDRQRLVEADVLRANGWLNVYRYFTRARAPARIWPRGLPLDAIHRAQVGRKLSRSVDSPIQQWLVDGDPDVDAIHRMVLGEGTTTFRVRRPIALQAGTWCPFNSQNTVWWPDAFVLMYLPAQCSFRMTDIWRSFVAQRVAWAQGWSILFHSPNARQVRNPHSLMDDFELEVAGYINNSRIARALQEMNLSPGSVADAMRECYERLVALGIFQSSELLALDAWLSDVEALFAAAIPVGHPVKCEVTGRK